MNTYSRARTSGRVIVASALAATLSSHLCAQEARPAGDETSSAAPAVNLEPVTVTARRVAEPALQVPSYTQVITRDQIQQSGASNLIDLLQSQANLYFTSFSGSPTNTKVSLRGTGSSGSGRTLVLLDGIRTNRADMGEFNWLQFSLQDIESIEVIQGPQGAYYGDNAVGGVIKINTLSKPQRSGGSAKLVVGSDHAFKLAGGYTQVFDGGLWANVSAGRDETDGWRDNSAYESDAASLGVGYDNGKNSVTRLRVSVLENDYEQPGFLTRAQYEDDPRQEGSSTADGTSRYRRLTLNNEFGATENVKLLTDGGFNRVDETYNGAFSTSEREIDSYFVSPKLHVKSGAFTFTPGVDLTADRISVDVAGFFPAEASIDRFVTSPYLAAEWAVSEQVTLSGSVRREWNSLEVEERVSNQNADRTDTSEAYQLAVNYRPRAEVRLYAKYDHGFRFPAADEVAFYQGFVGPVFFNRDLAPEVGDNFEVGLDYRNRGWTAGFALYHLTTEDEIFYNNVANVNENLAETRRVGAQLNAGYDAGVAALRSRIDFVDAELVETAPGSGLNEGPIRMTPEWLVTTTGLVRPIPTVEASVTHRYVGSRLADDSYATNNPEKVGSVSLFDAQVSYAPKEWWRVFAGVNNVFDERYVSYALRGFPPPTFIPQTVFYPGQGRFVYAGSSVRF